MAIYRLEIEGGETLWITAHDERGAIEMASAHLADDPGLGGDPEVSLVDDSAERLVLQANAGQWVATPARLDALAPVRGEPPEEAGIEIRRA